MPSHHTPTGTDLIPAIGYIRVSTYLEEQISPEIQRAAILDWAARNGREIVDWVQDLDATGRNFKRKIMAAIEAIEAGRAQEVAVWKFSRFGRNRRGVEINLARIEDVGGALQSATESVDAHTAVGRLTRGVLLDIAAFESDRAGEQWKEAHAWRRARGLPATGGKRFGYLWTPRRVPDPDRPGSWILQDECYAPDPATGPILADLYQRHITGEGFYTLAGWLNDHGHLNTRGHRWSQNMLARYLDSGFGAGLLIVHRTDTPCGNPSACQKWRDHYHHIPADHPAVITETTWHAYREHRDRIRALPPRARAAVYPLSGLVRCARCGSSANTTGKTRGYAYRCTGHTNRSVDCPGFWIRRTVVETAVYDWLTGLADDLDRRSVGQVVEPPATAAPDTTTARRRLTREAAKLTAALDRAAEAYAMGDIPRESYLRTRDTITVKLRDVQKELDDLAETTTAEEGPAPHHEVVEGLVSDWRVLTVQTKRDLLAKLIRHITVGPDGVHVHPVWSTDAACCPVATRKTKGVL